MASKQADDSHSHRQDTRDARTRVDNISQSMLIRRASTVRTLSTLLAPTIPHVEVLSASATKSGHPIAARNVYCVGRNYEAHAVELGNEVPKEEPVIFLKSSAALRGLDPTSASQPSVAYANEEFSYECELVYLVGTHVPVGQLKPGDEYSCIEAIGLGLDLTRRGKQTELKGKGLPWTLAKSFHGSAIVSPMLRIDSSFDLADISFALDVKKTRRQEGHIRQMIFDVPYLLRFLNSFGALLPGDLLFTGECHHPSKRRDPFHSSASCSTHPRVLPLVVPCRAGTPEGVGKIKMGDSFSMKFLSGVPLGNRKTPAPFKGQL